MERKRENIELKKHPDRAVEEVLAPAAEPGLRRVGVGGPATHIPVLDRNPVRFVRFDFLSKFMTTDHVFVALRG